MIRNSIVLEWKTAWNIVHCVANVIAGACLIRQGVLKASEYILTTPGMSYKKQFIRSDFETSSNSVKIKKQQDCKLMGW